MTSEQKLLIDAVSASVTGYKAVLESEPNWEIFLILARIHKIEALVYDGLQKSHIALPEAIQQHLSSAYMQAIFTDAQMEYRKETLQSALEDSGIKHAFLKGMVLKHSYPVPALRTMCDMDILVCAEDFNKIDRVAKELGGKPLHGDGNHRNYAFEDGIIVEFHPNLLHHAAPVGTDINPGWQYARESICFSKELTEEGVYLNTVCHLANHFLDGGVGVRFVLDVWVNRYLRKPEMDRRFVEEEFKRFGLYDFAQKIESLADAWFGSGEMTALLEELGNYILTSGSHGTTDRAMLNAMSLSTGGSHFSALWKKAFYPKAELEDRFPWCRGKPMLLPAAWCCRAYKAITSHGDLILKWSKETGNYDKKQVDEHREMLKRFGIQKKN